MGDKVLKLSYFDFILPCYLILDTLQTMNFPNPIRLSNSVAIPPIGLGVWQIPEGRETEAAVMAALGAGYRLIDTAKFYGNEASVGRAVREFVASGKARREDIFVTTKLWPTDFFNPEGVFDRSFRKLDLGYIDLYLIHWPSPVMPKNIWRTLERVYEQKLARAIGVSNYDIHDLKKLLSYANVPPAVNQVKFSVFDHDLERLAFCKETSIVVEAYSPLERGRGMRDETLERIAAAHGKFPAQVMIRWCVEHGTIPIPKSRNADRIRENLDVFDFKLSTEEMEELDALS